MATPSVSESTSTEFASVSSVSLTVTAASGALLVAAFAGVAANRPMSVNDATNGAGKDSQNNTWTALTENTEAINEYRMRIFYAKNVASGSTTVRLLQDSSLNTTGQAVLIEVANASTTSPFDVESQFDNSSATTHYAAAVGAIDTAADVFVLVAGEMNVDRGAPTAKSGWTRVTPSGTVDNRIMFQYRTSSGALTDERGEWTQPTGSNSAAVIASFKADAAPSGTTITPTAGSVSLTGAACSLGLAFGLTAGALTFTGGTPSVLVSQTITPTAGAVTITGAAPSAQIGYQIAPTAGAVTFTGGTPDVGISYVITPQAGAITLTGAAPTVTASDGVVARPDAGSVAFTGYAPTVLVPVTVVPTAGSVTFTGAAPSVLVGLRIEPAAGSVTVTGGTPAVGISYAITPSTGTVTVIGDAPTVGVSYVVGMTAGSVTLTGDAPTVTVLDGSIPITPSTAWRAPRIDRVWRAPRIDRTWKAPRA